jgi:hypothetical protein
LTKFYFVLYFLLENSYKSNLGVFIYKNAQKVKSPNFAYKYISCSVACIKIFIFIFLLRLISMI